MIGGPVRGPRLLKGYGSRRASISLLSYSLVLLGYNALLAAFLRRCSRSGQGSAQRNDLKDLLLLGTATHKLSRLITRGAVTAPFRAPLTRYRQPLGYGEFLEESRRDGLAGALGDLVTCNYCADPWVALALMYGLSRYPRAARPALGLFSSIAVADFLHVAYEMNRTRENVLTLREEQMEKKKAA